MRWLVALIPIIAAMVAIVFRHIVVRIVSVTAILLTAVAMSGALIAASRLAWELTLPASQSADWSVGAQDARDVIHSVVVPLLSTLAALGLIASVPRRNT